VIGIRAVVVKLQLYHLGRQSPSITVDPLGAYTTPLNQCLHVSCLSLWLVFTYFTALNLPQPIEDPFKLWEKTTSFICELVFPMPNDDLEASLSHSPVLCDVATIYLLQSWVCILANRGHMSVLELGPWAPVIASGTHTATNTAVFPIGLGKRDYY
jgi:hypothetical protein